MEVSERRILLLAFLSEGALLLLYSLWSLLWVDGKASSLIPPAPLGSEIILGGLSAVVLFLANLLLLKSLARGESSGGVLQQFIDSVVWPLSQQLSIFGALLIGIMAGIGEELFFRGMLQTELGILLSSMLFALMHFGFAAKKFFPVVLIYFLVSLYIGLVFRWTDSLWVVVILHSVYDFLALLYLRFFIERENWQAANC